MKENLKELYQYRVLLQNLISRELKIRYRGSVLGFLWTFLNPLILMGIYYLVFSVYMRNSLPNYAYFMFVGLLPWIFLSNSIISGTSSISDRRDLITKVKFPPQILPMILIGSALMNYLFSLPILIGFGLLFRIPYGAPLLLFPVILLIQFFMVSGIVYITSSLNVFFRDLQHILGNLVSFCFFLTPIVYAENQIPKEIRLVAIYGNPFSGLISSYHDIFYYNRFPSLETIAIEALIALVLFSIGCFVIQKRREEFAEVA